jgi:cholesterol transport system auxiliary component
MTSNNAFDGFLGRDRPTKQSSRRGALRGALVFLAATALAGCTVLPPQTDDVTLYVLAADSPHERPAPRRDVVIEVAQPRAWPGFDTAQIAYVRKPYELDYFAKSRWADTPARMLAPLLARALERTAAFRAVVPQPSAVAADYRLDTEIVRLRQNFAVQPSRAELTLRGQLTDLRNRRVVASRTFEETENAPSENASGGVVAINAALERALAELAGFCVAESVVR